ncbi:MAG: response regulator [Deltaproteobacteria bacterium]|nr:response regulator [Deltaproteobacteria bacterium]MBW2066685.1 response regulator [Deltaproteobacteria bacterium]
MYNDLKIIVLEDDPGVCKILSDMIKRFYTWGPVVSFTNPADAIFYCRGLKEDVALFVLDVFLKDSTCFEFLDGISEKFPMAHENSIIISGHASEDVVNMCTASYIKHLLEKPVGPYALQHAVLNMVSRYIRWASRLSRCPGPSHRVEAWQEQGPN